MASQEKAQVTLSMRILNMVASGIQVPLAIVAIYMFMTSSPVLLALSPYLASALLAISCIFFAYTAYEFFYEQRRKYADSLAFDVALKLVFVLLAVATVVTSISFVGVAPLVNFISSGVLVGYFWAKTLYHGYQAITSLDPEEKKEQWKETRSSFLYLTYAVIFLGLMLVNKVAHVGMLITTGATVLMTLFMGLGSVAVAAYKMAGASTISPQKNLEEQSTTPHPTPTPAPTPTVTQAPIPRQEKAYQGAPYQHPEYNTREELLGGLEKGIEKARHDFQSFGHVSRYGMQVRVLEALQTMIRSPEKGTVSFLDKTYQWQTPEALKAVIKDLQKEAKAQGLLESAQGSKGMNEVKFLFSESLKKSMELTPLLEASKKPGDTPTEEDTPSNPHV